MRKSVVVMIGCGVLGSLALVGCGGDDGGGGSAGAGGGAPTYAEVSAILGGPETTGIGKCAASSCHGGEGAGKANLNFKKAADVAAVLVGVDACENNAMKRVKAGDPENSWLWIKLTAEITDTTGGQIKFQGTPSGCSGVSTGFGTRMPQAFGTFAKLSETDLATIHDWIEAGAPGPQD